MFMASLIRADKIPIFGVTHTSSFGLSYSHHPALPISFDRAKARTSSSMGSARAIEHNSSVEAVLERV